MIKQQQPLLLSQRQHTVCCGFEEQEVCIVNDAAAIPTTEN
jgi:hypothetical protein